VCQQGRKSGWTDHSQYTCVRKSECCPLLKHIVEFKLLALNVVLDSQEVNGSTFHWQIVL